MTRNKKGLDCSPDLRTKKQTNAGALVSLYDSIVTPQPEKVNIPLGDPRPVFICWACGSTKDLTTFHATGGKLAICASCKNGGIK